MKIKGELTQVITTEIGMICDSCGNKTNDMNEEGWYSFRGGHGEWGNDSFESFKNYDVCSAKCYLDQLKELHDDNTHNRSYEADDKDLTFLKGLIEHNKAPSD